MVHQAIMAENRWVRDGVARRSGWALAALVLAAGGGQAFGQSTLILAEYAFSNPRFVTLQRDGSNPSLLFAPPTSFWLPIGVAFNPANGRLYWVDSAGSSEVVSAALDGSSRTVTPVTGFARGVSLDAQGRVYFSSGNTLRRMNADGSGITTLFTSSRTDPIGNPRVDATNGHVYVGAAGEIIRVNLDGSNQLTIVRGVSQPRAIALDLADGFIYWIDADTLTDFVARARLDGSDFTILIDASPNVTQSSGLTDLLVDPATDTLWYLDELTDRVYRAGTDGSGATPIYTTPTGLSPSGITLTTGEPAQALRDCNANGVPDDVDIANGASDCDANGVPDSCQVDACPTRVFLLDQGSDAVNTQGRAVGVPSRWQVFQPFDVPAGGWSIGEIGVDGYMSGFADGSGLTVSIFPDNGTGQLPDESNGPLATSEAFSLLFNTYRVNWAYAPLAISLSQGRFWARIDAVNPNLVSASINFGTSGLQSRSRGSSGNFTAFANPIALRLVEAQVCAADFNEDGQADFFDYLDFAAAYAVEDPSADFNNDGQVDFFDYLDFAEAFSEGC
ncbi:MAG: hypothetical protein SFZ23_00385 [Planctomycetota bacterium]|nr:hypothetical protein [Planctomycetota bacterium]